jgi:alpha-galactosidase
LNTDSVLKVSSDGVCLLVDISSGTPVVLHWGKEIGTEYSDSDLRKVLTEAGPHSDIDNPPSVGIWRENSRGFYGRPTILGHRAGLDWSQKFDVSNVAITENSIEISCLDQEAKLEASVRFELDQHGVLFVSQSVKNLGETVFDLSEITTWLPLPDHASQSMDFTGRWVNERQPQSRDIQVGTWTRESREGRGGHDYTIVQLAMTSDANFQAGQVWSLGLAWSGNSRHIIEKLPTGRISIGAGELLMPGEMLLESKQEYHAPTVIAAYSSQGIDGISDRMHRMLRARPSHPTNLRPRPLTLNVWEAVYFDHNLEKLTQLADAAKEVGVERFVLDDGWFGSRRNDTSGLGDWVVSKEVWPNGLAPLADVLADRGIEFGLWFEGEMVNPDSDLYRAHPEWILKIGDRIPPNSRSQQVLDLTHPDAYDHILRQVSEVLSSCKISYIKWDHNRALMDSGHLGKPAVREQTRAIYRLFDELKERFPGLEIESCASGGGRIDLGMASHVDRFWTSDCNDALERQYIQRYTQVAIPPEMLGSHIGPTQSHTTYRVHSLSFRAITALFGHAGIEWDITQASQDEIQTLKSWALYYKQNRDLLHSGRVVRVSDGRPDRFVHGVIATDKSRAIFAYVALRSRVESKPSSFRVPGLEPDGNYRVKMVFPAGDAKYIQKSGPLWTDGVVLTGLALDTIGLRPGVLAPENAFLIELERL